MEWEHMDTKSPVIPPPPDYSQVPAPPTDKPAQGPLMSSPKGFYGPGLLANLESRVTGKTPQQAYEKRVPQLETAASVLGSVLAPGQGVLRQAAGQALVGGGLEAIKGTGPLSAIKATGAGAGGSLAGSGLAAGVKSIASPLLKKAADTKVASQLTDYLKEKVPAWSGMKTLGQMLYSQRGINRLHEAYDEALKDVVTKGAGKEIVIPEDVARKLGVGMKGMVASKITTGQGMPNSVAVDAGELAQKMTGKWKGMSGAYRVAANALDTAGIGDPAARAAYKTAMGVREYMNKAGALGKSGRQFDLMAAQSKLGSKQAVDELLKRGIGQDVIDMLLPEGAKAITKGTQKVPGAILGVLSGMAGGHGAGLPGIGLGGAGGEFIGQRLGQMIPKYGNLPATPAANAITQLLSRLGGTAGTKGPLGP